MTLYLIDPTTSNLISGAAKYNEQTDSRIIILDTHTCTQTLGKNNHAANSKHLLGVTLVQQ